MTDDRFTAILAERIMGWKIGPERIFKGGRSWAPRWHFQPLRRLEHARQLLAKTNANYSLVTSSSERFTAVVRIGDRTGSASSDSEAAALTIAIANAIGIEVTEELE